MMLMLPELLYSNGIVIVSVFSFSTFLASFLCRMRNKPLFNYDNKFEKKIMNVISISTITITEVTLLSTYIIYPRLENVQFHTFSRFSFNIFQYILWVEFFYYVYHYWIHHSSCYKLIHAKHHESTQIFPLDTFYLNFIDMQFLIASMMLPLFLVKLNMLEHILTMSYYITMGYLSHSDAFHTHHVLHHKYFKCNYCFTLPIFDIICGTYRE